MQTPLLSQKSKICIGEINFSNIKKNSLANVKASQPTQDAEHAHWGGKQSNHRWCTDAKEECWKIGVVKTLDSFLEQQRRQYQQAGSVWGSSSDWTPALTRASARSRTVVKLPPVAGLGSWWSLWTQTLLGGRQFSLWFSKPTQIHEHKTHHSQHNPFCWSCRWRANRFLVLPFCYHNL